MPRISFSFRSVLLVMAVFMICQSHAQDGLFKNIAQRLEKYNQLYLREKIYLHSDKDFYIAGEIVWFKIYYVDGGSHQPIHVSKVAYVEILDRNNKAVLQAKIPLADNGGNGSFYLPLTLNSDYYTLKAYTNWMKNAGNEIFFEKKISVVNTVRTAVSSSSGDAPAAEATFFPEGGHLVEGIETTIAFRITGKNGKGTDARGIVTDNTGDTILQFSPHRFGIGHFTFKPVAGKSYTAIILLPGGKYIHRALPVAEPFGYVMNVTDNKDGRLKVVVQAKARQTNQAGEDLFLLAHNPQSIKFSAQRYISYNNELVFYIDKVRLGEGVNHVTLFNKDQQPVCERLVFIHPSSPVPAEITSNKKVYAARQPVDLSVLLKSNTDIDAANCSVSVYQLDSLQEAGGMNIVNYFSLLSDLKGNIESPAWYFSHEEGVDEAMDNLLLTHGWRRFRWDSILDDRPVAAFKFIPEYRGHVISGKVINTTSGMAVANADCFLTVPSAPFGFYISQSDSTGSVKFEVRNYYGPGEIIAQVGEQNKNNYRVDINSPFADDSSSSGLSYFALPEKSEYDLLQKSIAMQAQNIYRPDSIRKFTVPLLQDTLPFFGRAEYAYLLDDYKRFTTMEEVLREYVIAVNVVLRNSKLYMSIFDDATRQIYHDNILVMLDGVPLSDYNKIFSYDPLKVKKLEVVPRRYLFGSRIFSGIASFETYNGKFDGFELNPALLSIDYEGLQLQREFYSPVYQGGDQQSRIPDLRTTLYWTPELLTDRSGKANLQFYTSDQKGKFIVVLEGISKKGNAVFGTATFSVE
ncbi:MAG: hypothetical protein WDO71_27120 [Bacteroidota bacterium]